MCVKHLAYNKWSTNVTLLGSPPIKYVWVGMNLEPLPFISSLWDLGYLPKSLDWFSLVYLRSSGFCFCCPMHTLPFWESPSAAGWSWQEPLAKEVQWGKCFWDRLSAAKMLNRTLGEVGIVREVISVGEREFKTSWYAVPGKPHLGLGLALMSDDSSTEPWDCFSDGSREGCEMICHDWLLPHARACCGAQGLAFSWTPGSVSLVFTGLCTAPDWVLEATPSPASPSRSRDVAWPTTPKVLV